MNKKTFAVLGLGLLMAGTSLADLRPDHHRGDRRGGGSIGGDRSGDGHHRRGDRDRDHRRGDRDRHHDRFYIDGYCDLAFDDDNRNGVGSIEGYCEVEVPRYLRGEQVRLVIKGRSDRRTYYARVNRRGYASFRFSNHNARDWEDRRVRVIARIDGEREQIFGGFLPYN